MIIALGVSYSNQLQLEVVVTGNERQGSILQANWLL